jgi:hypothetical protein
LSRGWVLPVAVVGGVLALVFVFARPHPVAAVATLDECFWGSPVVAFEGEEWRSAVPDNLGASAPNQIPVASWPIGMQYDAKADVLLDSRGDVVYRKGDRVRVAGTFVRGSGDTPCYYTVGVNIESITSP